MSEEAPSGQEMSAFQKIIGIFTTPHQTFEAIDQKPTWFLPFIIGVFFFLIMQVLTIDIQTTDQIAMMETRDMSQQQLDAAKSQMSGPLKYLSLIAGPIVWLIMILILAALFYVAGNLMIGGDSSFKKVFAIVCWAGLVGVIGIILMTLLMLSKGTTQGIALDLTVLLDTPAIGEEKSTLYRIFSKFDVFSIWQIVLWIIGMAVTYKTTIKKAAVPIISLWVLWMIISVSFGGFFEGLGM